MAKKRVKRSRSKQKHEREEAVTRLVSSRDRNERDEGEGIRRRAEWMQQFLGVADLCRLREEVDSFRSRKTRLRPLPRSSADVVDSPLRSELQILGRSIDGLKVSWAKNPAKRVTWGHTGRYVDVEARGPFPSARLRFVVSKKDIAHLYPDSVFVARWDENTKRFCLIPQSTYNHTGGYVFARITRPGLYTAIGLPSDPRILATLRLFSVMRAWLTLDPNLGPRFINPICKVILCADFMKEVIRDEKWLSQFELNPNDFPGGFGGGDICEECLGVDPDILPELGIIDLIDFPVRVIKPPIVFPPIWPRPCRGWENVGPVNVTGRIGVLAIHPTDGNRVFAGGTGGGVWRTIDGGNSWEPLMSGELSLAIGGLGISHSDPNVLYAATGEWTAGIGFPVDPVTSGVGAYRTRNGGQDWDLCASISSTFCAAVAVDPTNPNRVFVAGNRALHRTVNGGATWEIPPGNTDGIFDGQISDVVIDPNDVNRIYMGVHRDGVYRSTDGGDTWTRLQNGIATGAVADAPKIALGRIGAHGTQFVAVKMGDRVYTSIDGGNSFSRQTDTTDGIWFFAWCNMIAVDPTNEDVLFAGGSNLYRSTDGGSTWTQVGGYGTNVHADQQGVVFDPNNHNRLYVCTDGGIWASADNGVNWNFASRGLVATHFYVMAVSQTATLRYGGSIQDDDGYAYKGAADWEPLRSGEGGYVEYDPSNEMVIYHDTWSSQLRKSTDGGASWSTLGIDTDTNYGEPLAIARGDSNLLLALKTTGQIARSTDGGTTWNDVLNPGVQFSAICFAPSNDNHAYAGSMNGRVWHSSDGGANWAELDTTALPNARIQSMVVDWTDPLRVSAAFAGTGIRHLFRGDLDAAGNVTWVDVSGVLPAVSLPDLPLTGLALHPVLDEVIYVSTLLGVLRSVDGGDSWEPFDEGLPNAFVSDLDMRSRDGSLFASTMGRGMYRRYV